MRCADFSPPSSASRWSCAPPGRDRCSACPRSCCTVTGWHHETGRALRHVRCPRRGVPPRPIAWLHLLRTSRAPSRPHGPTTRSALHRPVAPAPVPGVHRMAETHALERHSALRRENGTRSPPRRSGSSSRRTPWRRESSRTGARSVSTSSRRLPSEARMSTETYPRSARQRRAGSHGACEERRGGRCPGNPRRMGHASASRWEIRRPAIRRGGRRFAARRRSP